MWSTVTFFNWKDNMWIGGSKSVEIFIEIIYQTMRYIYSSMENIHNLWLYLLNLCSLAATNWSSRKAELKFITKLT